MSADALGITVCLYAYSSLSFGTESQFTAKLNGLNPEAWLKDTLEKLPTWPNSRIDELLPFPVASVDSESQD